MRKIILAIAAAAATLAVPMTPAFADDGRNGPYYRDDDRHGRYYRNDDRRDRYYRGDYRRGRDHDNRGRYYQTRRDDRRYNCERESGTTGLIIGGAGGALLGREIDGGRERTLGTVLGAAAGALLGREVDRSDDRCR